MQHLITTQAHVLIDNGWHNVWWSDMSSHNTTNDVQQPDIACIHMHCKTNVSTTRQLFTLSSALKCKECCWQHTSVHANICLTDTPCNTTTKVSPFSMWDQTSQDCAWWQCLLWAEHTRKCCNVESHKFACNHHNKLAAVCYLTLLAMVPAHLEQHMTYQATDCSLNCAACLWCCMSIS